jgi:hypothetical protein
VRTLGERHLRFAISEFVEHYHLERNHQGLEMDRALTSERDMHRRQEHLAQAIALVGIVTDRGDRASGGGGELGERTRGQRERRSRAA